MTRLDLRDLPLLSRLPDAAIAGLLRHGDFTVSPRLAASMTRRSGRVIREAIAKGSLPADFDGYCWNVPVLALAAWADRSFTSNDLLRAARRLVVPAKEPTSNDLRPE